LKVNLVDLISITKPHLQQLPSHQLSGIVDYSISSVSIDARSVQRDLTEVNIFGMEDSNLEYQPQAAPIFTPTELSQLKAVIKLVNSASQSRQSAIFILMLKSSTTLICRIIALNLQQLAR